jgi:CheY-like chemotaxis protein
MDVQMPEMDGFEATRIIRADPRFAQLPIIAMTAHTVPEFKVKCFEAGMNDYLSKPLEKEKFFEKLHFWLRPNPTSASKSF